MGKKGGFCLFFNVQDLKLLNDPKLEPPFRFAGGAAVASAIIGITLI